MSNNPSGAIHPTLFMLLWALSSFGFQYLWPLKVFTMQGLPFAGRILGGLGCLLLVWGQLTLRLNGTPIDHSKPTTSLVTSGPFAFSRNPVYLAMIAIFVGLGIASVNAWAILMTIPFVVAVQRFTIRPEENYLNDKFGTVYENYCNSVRRWV